MQLHVQREVAAMRMFTDAASAPGPIRSLFVDFNSRCRLWLWSWHHPSRDFLHVTRSAFGSGVTFRPREWLRTGLRLRRIGANSPPGCPLLALPARHSATSNPVSPI